MVLPLADISSGLVLIPVHLKLTTGGPVGPMAEVEERELCSSADALG